MDWDESIEDEDFLEVDDEVEDVDITLNQTTTTTTATTENENEKMKTVSHILCYLLRHGAIKEGMMMYQDGYVDFEDLHKKIKGGKLDSNQLMNEINTSLSHEGGLRFSSLQVGKKTYIKANYGHSIGVKHLPPVENKKVPSLMNKCVKVICDHIDRYEFEGLKDCSLLEMMIIELKKRNKLTVALFKKFFVANMERLSFESIYVSEGAFKMAINNCIHLRELDLKGCGYFVTDNTIEYMSKRTGKLRRLILCENKTITDVALNAIAKNNKELRLLDLQRITNISIIGVKKILSSLSHLEELNLKSCRQLNIKDLKELAQKYPKCNIIYDELDFIIFNSNLDPIWGALSNNYSSPFKLKDSYWPTVTHYYQSQKFEGSPLAEQIRVAQSPSDAFRLGRRGGGIRRDWEEVKERVMEEAVWAKFSQNPSLASVLISSKDSKIIFGSMRDNFWGKGINGNGKNALGLILIRTREKLLASSSSSSS